jgi:hypothetical protein
MDVPFNLGRDRDPERPRERGGKRLNGKRLNGRAPAARPTVQSRYGSLVALLQIARRFPDVLLHSSLEPKYRLVTFDVDNELAALFEFAEQDLVNERLLDMFVNRAGHGARSVNGVVTFL